MNLNNYTQKSLEAVQSARDLAVASSHQQLEQIHLLLALLRQEGGLTPQLLLSCVSFLLSGAAGRRTGSTFPLTWMRHLPLPKSRPGS